MRNGRVSNINPNAKYDPKLDDYELPAEIHLDPSKMKPNRFAGRVKLTHGNTRKVAGRKPAPEPIERHMITFYKSHAKYLRSLDSNLSQAIRKLIAKAKE